MFVLSVLEASNTKTNFLCVQTHLAIKLFWFWSNWLNHWCHMDYFNYVLTTFLGFEHVSWDAVYAGSEICVPRINEDLTGLERH